jgi:uncharacterized protein (DUF2141 family)
VNLGLGGGSINGNIFNDRDADRTRDAGEFGLPAWRVFIDSDKDGLRDANEKTAVTDGAGNYHLTGLAPGTYRVRVLRGTGYRATAPSAGYVDVTISSGQKVTGKNFGVTQKVLISGSVFNDLDRDGVKDAGEAGKSGWRIYLDADNDGVFDAGELNVLSDSAGNYRFNNLSAGKYTVRIVKQSGYTVTTASSYAVTLGVGAAISRLFGVRQS